MPKTPMWRRYLRFWGPDPRADLDVELSHHLDALVERLVSRGMSVAAAREEAERRFGNRDRIEAECLAVDEGWERQKRWGRWLDDLRHDARVGVRSLRRSPTYTAFACAVLPLGIGSATTVYSLLDALLLRPFPCPEPERIVSVVRHQPTYVGRIHDQQTLAFVRNETRTLGSVSALGLSPGVNLSSEHGTTFIQNLEVTAGYFAVLGVPPVLGRAFDRGDELKQSTVILSNGLWQRPFDRDPQIVGAPIQLGGRTHTVIGVAAPELWTFEPADAWTTFRPDPTAADRNYRLIGRLADEVTLVQASAEMERLGAELARVRPSAVREQERLGARSHQATLATGIVPVMSLMGATVFLVLLVVCANTAGLQLARATGRTRELAVHAALGSTRGRLLRQLLTESVLLGLAGGPLGVSVAYLGLPTLVRLRPLLGMWNPTIDVRVLAAALVLSLASGVAFGLLPAWRSSRTAPGAALRSGDARGATSAHAPWMRRVLIVGQVAVCTVLLAGAALFIRTFVNLNERPLGFNPDGVLTARASLQGPRYADTEGVTALFRRTIDELRRVPGVNGATVVNNLPVERGLNLALRSAADRPTDPAQIDWRYVSGDYLDVMGIPLRAVRNLLSSRVVLTPDTRDGKQLIPQRLESVKWQAKASVRYWAGLTVIRRPAPRRISTGGRTS